MTTRDIPFTAGGRDYVAVVYPPSEGCAWSLVVVLDAPTERIVGYATLQDGALTPWERVGETDLPRLSPAARAVLPRVVAQGMEVDDG